MYRISVTTLEKFRRYMQEASPYDTEESLLDNIKGLFTGNDKTRFGSAYHKLIEGEFKIANKGLLVDADNYQFHFSADAARPGLQFKKNHPLMIHEIPLRKIYQSNFFPIQLSSKVDGVEGVEIWDHKCKFRSPDWREYMDSIQWKFYLDILDLKVFYYNIFEVIGFDQLPAYQPYQIVNVIIHHEPLLCERYQGMEEDLQYWLNSFLEYIHQKNLLQFLKPAILQEDALNF